MVMKISFQELLDDLDNNVENNAEKLQELLNS